MGLQPKKKNRSSVCAASHSSLKTIGAKKGKRIRQGKACCEGTVGHVGNGHTERGKERGQKGGDLSCQKDYCGGYVETKIFNPGLRAKGPWDTKLTSGRKERVLEEGADRPEGRRTRCKAQIVSGKAESRKSRAPDASTAKILGVTKEPEQVSTHERWGGVGGFWCLVQPERANKDYCKQLQETRRPLG